MTKYGPWKIWNGGDCPVADGARGQVQLASGTRDEAEEQLVEFIRGYNWNMIGHGQIIAYREEIVPVVRVGIGYVHMFGEKSMSVYGGAHLTGDSDIRNHCCFKITITDDEPSIEWVE